MLKVFYERKKVIILLLSVLSIFYISGCNKLNAGKSLIKNKKIDEKILKSSEEFVSESLKLKETLNWIKSKIAPNLNNKNGERVPVLSGFPRTDTEFFQVHPEYKYRTQYNKTSVEKALKKLAPLENDIENLTDLQSLYNIIENSQNRLIIFLGHNEDGYLKLLNGESVEINKLQNLISGRNSIPIFLSCKSRIYGNSIIGVTHNPDYVEGSQHAIDLSAYIRQNSTDWKNLSNQEIQKKLQGQLDYLVSNYDSHKKRKRVVSGITTIIVVNSRSR